MPELQQQPLPDTPSGPADGEGDATILGFPALLPEDEEAEWAADEPDPEVPRQAAEAEPAADQPDPEVPRQAAEAEPAADQPDPEVPRHAAEAAAGAGAGQLSTAVADATVTTGAAVRMVPLRRADRFGGLVLVLAGVAAGLSLLLPWIQGTQATGLSLVRAGIGVLGSGVANLVRSGLWQPLAVVLGGGVLLVLGLLLLVPTRSHRLVGVLALLAAVTAAAGIAVPLAGESWRAARLDLGTWIAVAVPVLGLLGAMKAMLTAPRVTLRPRRPAGAAPRGRRSPRHRQGRSHRRRQP